MDGSQSKSFDTTTALDYFHDTGIVLHYSENPVFKQWVTFFIMDLFKALFHHNITETLDYNTNKIARNEFKEQKFQMALTQYAHEGLLNLKLLKLFWYQYNLGAHEHNVLLKLMKRFDICYPVTPDEKLLYLPWFTELKECPSHINTEEIYMTTEQLVAQQYCIEFFNQIPLNVLK